MARSAMPGRSAALQCNRPGQACWERMLVARRQCRREEWRTARYSRETDHRMHDRLKAQPSGRTSVQKTGLSLGPRRDADRVRMADLRAVMFLGRPNLGWDANPR